jgi:hypothetical protein
MYVIVYCCLVGRDWAKEVVGMEEACLKCERCDWLVDWVNNLSLPKVQPQGDASSFLHPPTPSYPLYHVRNGFPPFGIQPEPGS